MPARPTIAPRLLTPTEAAHYCGFKATGSLRYVAVKPLRVGSEIKYDVRQLDRWIDERSGLAPVSPPDSGPVPANDAPEDPETALQGWLVESGFGETPRRS